MEKLPYKIIAKVRVNSEIAIVLNNPIRMIYKQVDNVIYGTDGLFYNCYYYEQPSSGFKAFGGREFYIKLDTGETVKCNGQWWDGGQAQVSKVTGVEIVSVTAQTTDKLKECYVFCGYSADKAKFDEFLNSSNVPTYNYRDYEKILMFDDMRSKYYDDVYKLNQDKNNLIKSIKEKHNKLTKLEKLFSLIRLKLKAEKIINKKIKDYSIQ